VSSQYRLICVSHNPAIVQHEPEWHSGSGGRQVVERLLAFDAPPIVGHESCKVVAGAFSYPLVDVYLPPEYERSNGEWIDACWLKALWHLNQVDPDNVPYRLKNYIAVANSLRFELGCVVRDDET
jgi:hypothetical protein